MKILHPFVYSILVIPLLFTGCSMNRSHSKYSEITKIHYEETVDGYKAALYRKEDITVDTIKDWIERCETNNQYYEFIYSDPDSWDMFLYFPFENNQTVSYSNFNFHVEHPTVKVYVESDPVLNETAQDHYLLIRIQAPMRANWPVYSALFIDGKEIECSGSAF